MKGIRIKIYTKAVLLNLILLSKVLFSQNYDTLSIHINNIKFGMDNRGVFGEEVTSTGIKLFTQFDEGDVIYRGGFALSGLHNQEIWSNGVLVTSRDMEDYLPGKVGMSPDDERNKIYTVRSSDSDFGESWEEWKTAVELGADFYDGNEDGLYDPIDLNNNGKWDNSEDKPDILGDLTAWCVFNDLEQDTLRRFKEMTPKGIEVKQTIFVSASPNAGDLSNVIFVRYRIENTGTVSEKFDSTYFGFFLDPDIGESLNDYVGCDTNLQLAYAYNSVEDEGSNDWNHYYGERPPAVILYPLLQPHEYVAGETFIDNNGNSIFDPTVDSSLDSTEINRGSLLPRKIIPGSRKMNWNSFLPYNKCSHSIGNPNDEVELRNYMIGGRYSNGVQFTAVDFSPVFIFNDTIVDPSTVNPKFIGSGDPVTGIGWIHLQGDEGCDYRMLISYGPFTLRHNDPIEVMCAVIVGRGEDRLSSITEAKRIASVVKNVYDNNFIDLPVGVKENNEPIPTSYKLYQNYPNPFNPSTTIKYNIPSSSPLGKERTELGLVTLIIYDILGRKVATLVNRKQKPGIYEVNFNAKNLSSGIYFYKLNTGNFSITKKLILLK